MKKDRKTGTGRKYRMRSAFRRALFLELVAHADVVIENFRTGTFDKWGLGIDVLRKANPKIIVTHVTG